MPEACQPCECIPYKNLCCCPSQNGITVLQGKCQIIPSGSIVTNPCFSVAENTSYWTYKFLTNCDQGTSGISNFAIPICKDIPEDNIKVEEKIDSCGSFEEVEFELIEDDPNFGPAPEGFVFLKIETDDRYDVGVCVTYRVSILGNFPEAVECIFVKAGTPVLEFGCDDCYKVPGCNTIPKILVRKECTKTIEDNELTLSYIVHIDNVGSSELVDIQFLDNITFDGTNVTVDTVTVNPPLTVDQSVPGVITISGSLGNLLPGESIHVNIDLTDISFAAAGVYQFMQTAKAACCAVEASDSCLLTVDVVQLRGDKCCTSGTIDNSRIYRVTVTNVGNSPQTNVTLEDRLVVPAGVTVQFTSFNGCTAIFADTLLPVPLNTDVTNRTILITCENLIVPASSSINKDIELVVVSTSAFVTPVQILNTLDNIIFLNTSSQILLGIDNVPVSARIEVVGNIECLDPCNL